MRKPGPRPAVIGTCTLPIRDIRDADVLLANGLYMTLPAWIDYNRLRIAEERGGSPIMPPGGHPLYNGPHE